MAMNRVSSSVSQSQNNNGGSNRKKRLKSQEEPEDRISDLPDPLIQHILSFLPSTKDSINTRILSKRWLHQWTHVPILLFDSSGMTRMKFYRFINSTLARYDCSTILKFAIQTRLNSFIKSDVEFLFVTEGESEGLTSFTYLNSQCNMNEWIRFATRKAVRELILDFCSGVGSNHLVLPQFVLTNDLLVKLKLGYFVFDSTRKIEWRSLKDLHIGSSILPDKAIENVISGCSLLESLQLTDCHGFDRLVIGSTSLKRLVLEDLADYDTYCSVLEISCPNLEQLKLLQNLYFDSFKLLNLPASVCATLDFITYVEGTKKHSKWYWRKSDTGLLAENLVEEILRRIQHLKELKIGAWLMTVISVLEVVRGLSSPLLSTKCLTIDVHSFHTTLPGITCLLRNLPVLEKLVIRLGKGERFPCVMFPVIFESYDFGETYWNSRGHGNLFDCLVWRVKTVEIVGLEENCDHYELVLKFVEFILRSARVLEEMVIFQDQQCRPDFVQKLSKKLLSIPRCSSQIVVSVSCLTG